MYSSTSSNGTLPALGVISATDQRGLIVVITALLLSFVLLCFGARVYTRLYINGPWLRDDNALTAATAVGIIQASIVFLQVSKGYGQTEKLIEGKDILPIKKIEYASNLLYIFVLLLSKSSTALLVLRLSPGRGHAIACWTAIAAAATWAFMSILLVTLHCNATTECKALVLRWELVMVFDIVTEGVLFLLPVYIVAKLRTRLLAKATVIFIFALRLPLVGMAVLRFHRLRLAAGSADALFLSAFVTVWSQAELNYSIMACTLPCIGPFMSPFTNSYEIKSSQITTQRSGYSGRDVNLQYVGASRPKSDVTAPIVSTSAVSGAMVDEEAQRQAQSSTTISLATNYQQSIDSTGSQSRVIPSNGGKRLSV